MCFNTRHHHNHPAPRPFQTRREMLRRTSTGFGFLALSALMADRAYGGLAQDPSEGPLAAKPPPRPPALLPLRPPATALTATTP